MLLKYKGAGITADDFLSFVRRKIMRHINNILLAAFVAIFFVGCYTELGTVREPRTGQTQEYTYQDYSEENESEEDTVSSRYDEGRTYYDDYYYDRWYPRNRFYFRYYYPAYYWPSFGFTYGYYDPWYYYDCYWYYDPWICGTPLVIYPIYYYPYWYLHYPYFYPYYRYRHYYGYGGSIVRTNRDFGSTRGASIRTGDGRSGMRSGGTDVSGSSLDRARTGGRGDVPIVRDGGERRSGREGVTQRDGTKNRSSGTREGVRRYPAHRYPERVTATQPSQERKADRSEEIRGGDRGNTRDQVNERSASERRVPVREIPSRVRREKSAEPPQRAQVQEPRRSGRAGESGGAPSVPPSFSPPRSSPSPPMQGGDAMGGGGRSGGGDRSGGGRSGGRR